MKKGWILGLVLILQSCGILMLSDKDEQLTPLAVSSGGYLSTDDFNEITPFIYRYQNTNMLFFSSDRAGSYDIYYAVINPDGTFEAPVILPTNINSPDKDEIYPVLYNGFGLVLSFIRANSGSSNVINLMCWNLGFTNFNVYSGMPVTNSTGLGLLKNYLIVAYGGSKITLFDLSQSMSGTTNETNLLVHAYSANSITIPLSTNINTYSELYIKDSVLNGKHQITVEGKARFWFGAAYIVTNQAMSASLYHSSYNDISPFVDFENGYKIYFASDRYGNGNYDLYRYNLNTIDKLPHVAPLLSWDTSAPSVSFYSPTNGSVLGEGSRTIQVAASDTALGSGIYGVYCALDGGLFLKMTYVTSNWQVSMYLNAGFHTLKTYTVDKMGNCSETNEIIIEALIS
ncbi:MAG: hypothetical protein A2Y33_11265 [Spirochaetes bacterium GWF1_51_8]|nr:MAG: hypothetical protein A2Y33_11265 [Spirochaetes bacterium GWF1_51_8]